MGARQQDSGMPSRQPRSTPLPCLFPQAQDLADASVDDGDHLIDFVGRDDDQRTDAWTSALSVDHF